MFIIYLVGAQKYFDAADQAIYPPIYLQLGSLAAGDYDNDGKLDIACGGRTHIESGVALMFILYHQNSSLQYYDVTNTVTFPAGIPPGFSFGRVLFLDVSLDGLLDFFYAGSLLFYDYSGTSRLYIQSNSLTFEDFSNPYFLNDLPRALEPYFDFGSNSQGKLLFILIGGNIPFTIYNQNDSFIFHNISHVSTFPTGLPPPFMSLSNVLWNDFDRDKLDDFFFTWK